LLSKNNTSASTIDPEPLSHDLPENKPLSPDGTDTTNGTQKDQGSPREDEDLNHSNIDLFKVPEPMEEASKPIDYQGDCIMSLDISEYELQMLERQAKQEDLEEQSTLEFQVKSKSISPDPRPVCAVMRMSMVIVTPITNKTGLTDLEPGYIHLF
jgi:hypothetical protein